jgi:hypothetical protein
MNNFNLQKVLGIVQIYPKHGPDPTKQPNSPIIREGLAEKVLVRATEIGDTLSKEPAIILHTADTAQLTFFHFLQAIFHGVFQMVFM